MKITFKIKKETNAKESYPCFKKSIKGKEIVLFFNEMCGVVVSKSRRFPAYYFSDSWYPSSDSRTWAPVIGGKAEFEN